MMQGKQKRRIDDSRWQLGELQSNINCVCNRKPTHFWHPSSLMFSFVPSFFVMKLIFSKKKSVFVGAYNTTSVNWSSLPADLNETEKSCRWKHLYAYLHIHVYVKKLRAYKLQRTSDDVDDTTYCIALSKFGF